MEGSTFLSNVRWKSFHDPQGRTVVEASAIVNLEAYKGTDLDDSGTKLPADWVELAKTKLKGMTITYTAQFLISQVDDSVSLGFSGYHLKGNREANDALIEEDIKDTEYAKGLKSIFENQPDLQISAVLIAFSQDTNPPPQNQTPSDTPAN